MIDTATVIGCGIVMIIGVLAWIAISFSSKMDDFQASFEEKANKLHRAQLKMLTTIERMEKLAEKIEQETHPSRHIPTREEYGKAMEEAEALNGKKK